MRQVDGKVDRGFRPRVDPGQPCGKRAASGGEFVVSQRELPKGQIPEVTSAARSAQSNGALSWLPGVPDTHSRQAWVDRGTRDFEQKNRQREINDLQRKVQTRCSCLLLRPLPTTTALIETQNQHLTSRLPGSSAKKFLERRSVCVR